MLLIQVHLRVASTHPTLDLSFRGGLTDHGCVLRRRSSKLDLVLEVSLGLCGLLQESIHLPIEFRLMFLKLGGEFFS